MATNGTLPHTDQFPSGSIAATATSAVTADQTSGSNSTNNLGKDEVAWFFVEQYYTTLSKNPEKLHLFYGKRSQFVYGLEAEVANVSVGRQNIQDRIKQLDFQDCKVRVSNVDSQASFDNIVIQVIGETSNKAGDPKKFVQTFVLAQQPSGYFVLNDILRYIEEGDEEPTEVIQDEQAEPATQIIPVAKEEIEEQPVEPVEKPISFDAGVIDKKLEEVSAPKDATPTNGDVAAETAVGETAAIPEAAKKPEAEAAPEVPDPEVTAQEVAEEDTKEPEKPSDPSPTPVQARQPPAPAAAAAPVPAQPMKPMTWASRAAAAAGPKPVVPLAAKPATPAAAPQSRAAAAAQPAPSQSPTPAQGSEAKAPAATVKETPTEWQTAGNDSKRQNRPQSISGPQAEKDGTMVYVKYVTDKVQHDELRLALAQHGELIYFDINRQKNCAFVEFATPAGYQAALAANPHVVNGENIVVEPRRPKASAYGGSNYTTGRGGVQGRPGRGGFEGRSGSQGGGRGSFGGQGRGRGGAPRGRGTSQATNA
ncbi:uncharacterized protein GGS22DRAFT_191688 [Annulohypoxylon maeteangense]|uniref:uncharacterized protein n=1 Tax=Annulohypoxylon maeteangense TaxID=1927788 RepID=UPI002007C675|nr:uncharacterized protein GGS22DRAFT_191688 [Annulohypoxylon maeteangense]KAI0881959.1 hypothetical protein GGS22DRAFT_191688 [Annulohypoxylon maeteangense]